MAHSFQAGRIGARTGIYLATQGAEIARLASEGEMAPEVDLAQEMKLRSVAVLPPEPVTRTEILTLTGGGCGLSLGPQRQVFHA